MMGNTYLIDSKDNNENSSYKIAQNSAWILKERMLTGPRAEL
jgi:hypothetical protein